MPKPEGPRRRPARTPSLQDLCVACVVHNIQRFNALPVLPYDASLEIVQGVLQNQLLNPHVLELFKQMGHPELMEAFKDVKMLPPLEMYSRCGRG